MNTDVRDSSVVWIVLRRAGPNDYHIMGVAASCGEKSAEEMAVEMCLDETYLIGPMIVNSLLPEECIDWAGHYFPLAPHDRKTVLPQAPPDLCGPER